LILECKKRETPFSRADFADDVAISVYGTMVNNMRRVLQTLGLERRAEDVRFHCRDGS
jgi:hypothetical protein